LERSQNKNQRAKPDAAFILKTFFPYNMGDIFSKYSVASGVEERVSHLVQ
jgi:hypothetical protein